MPKFIVAIDWKAGSTKCGRKLYNYCRLNSTNCICAMLEAQWKANKVAQAFMFNETVAPWCTFKQCVENHLGLGKGLSDMGILPRVYCLCLLKYDRRLKKYVDTSYRMYNGDMKWNASGSAMVPWEDVAEEEVIDVE